jgi:hypothetical protein
MYNSFQQRELNFPQVFTEKHVPDREAGIIYEKRVEYLHVSSSDRDIVSYPFVNHYSVELNNTFKNISCIELIQATIPNVSTTEPFVVLKIDEIDQAVFSSNIYIDNAFAIIPFISSTGNWINLNCNKELIEKSFITPKSSLEKMTISLLSKNGNFFPFGLTGNIENDFVFKITTIQKSRNEINVHSVF